MRVSSWQVQECGVRRGQAGLGAYRPEGRAFLLCLGSGKAVWGRVPGVWLTVTVTLGSGPGWEFFLVGGGDQHSMFKANRG